MLFAGIEGHLSIDENNCLGVVGLRGDVDSFTTIVWPSNARLVHASGRWRVDRTDSDEAIEVGALLRGGGGFRDLSNPAELRDYNRFLTSKLSARCAKRTFGLNPDFSRG